MGTLMGEKDVSRIQAVEAHLSTELTERAIDEDEVLKLLNTTTKAQQKAELLLTEVGFDDELAQFKSRKQARKVTADEATENKRPADNSEEKKKKKKKSA